LRAQTLFFIKSSTFNSLRNMEGCPGEPEWPPCPLGPTERPSSPGSTERPSSPIDGKYVVGLLWRACRDGAVDQAQLVVDEFGLTSVDVRLADNRALRWACNHGHMDLVQSLLFT
jgi:hypothetical protein